MDSLKKTQAMKFINQVRTMDPGALNDLIVQTAGEELAQFFLTYSANRIAGDPEHVLENCSSLMLMGYLIRDAEVPESRGLFEHFVPNDGVTA